MVICDNCKNAEAMEEYENRKLCYRCYDRFLRMFGRPKSHQFDDSRYGYNPLPHIK